MADRQETVPAIRYKTIDTRRGYWKVYVYPTGASFREYRTYLEVGGRPFVHMTFGKHPETGTHKTARGVIAVGKYARGIVAIGQFAAGWLVLAQFGIGLLGVAQFGIAALLLCQFGLAAAAVGQVVVTALLGVGQFAVGYVAVGQLGVGKYVLAQAGIGKYLWTKKVADPVAVQFFKNLAGVLFGK